MRIPTRDLRNPRPSSRRDWLACAAYFSIAIGITVVFVIAMFGHG